VTTPIKIIGLCFLIVAALYLTYVWAELAYRWTLYLDYGSRPYLNHVDDDYFIVMPARATFGTWCGVIACGFAVWFRYRAFALLCVLMAIAGLLAPRVLDYYHRSLILVTYSEFSDHHGP